MIEYLKTFKEACVDYRSSEAQVLQNLQKLFDDEPKRFYMEKVATIVNIYVQAKAFLSQKYSSVIRQIHMRQYLQGLSLKAIMKEDLCDTIEALDKLCKTIPRYNLQSIASFCIEDAKVYHLYNAIVSFEWAILPLTQCYSHKPP